MVSDPNVPAIVVTANHVTLDLDGFTITGPNRCAMTTTYSGVVCTYSSASGVDGINVGGGLTDLSVRGLVLRNGTIRGFRGKAVYGSAGAQIENVVALENALGGIFGAFGSRVERVRATLNGGPGVYVVDGLVSDSVVELNQWGVRMAGGLVRGTLSRSNHWSQLASNTANTAYRENNFYGAAHALVDGVSVSLGNNLCSGVPC